MKPNFSFNEEEMTAAFNGRLREKSGAYDNMCVHTYIYMYIFPPKKANNKEYISFRL